MKAGLENIQALAAKIVNNAQNKRDYVASTAKIEMTDTAALALTTQDSATHVYPLNTLAHGQLSEYLGIPAIYARRMRDEAPALLAHNVNTWLRQNEPVNRLVRTMHGDGRAFLSDAYQPLENEDLAEAVLPIVFDLQLDILSCEITERKLYIKAVHPNLKRDVPTGKRMGDGEHNIFDTCAPAITISNSEVGAGMLKVESGVYTQACTNMATWSKDGMKRRHVGARHDLTDDLSHLFSDETKRATDEAIWRQIRDVVRGAFEEARFDARCKEMGALVEVKLDPTKVTDTVTFARKKFNLTETEGNSVLGHLIAGGDLTGYGLFNAVTRTAEDAESYDRASELEALGGKLIELPASQWRELARAA
jgi:hypothetical protein